MDSTSDFGEDGRLTHEQATSALAEFGHCHDNSFGFRTVSLVNRFLADIEILAHSAIFSNLQTVDVSGNCLRNLEPLMALPELRVLIASDNQLESTESVPRHKYLDTIDLSRNFLVCIGNWSSCPFLRNLSLRSNAIREIQGFETGPLLETLDLSDNQITDLSSLSAFQGLEKLDISDNQVTDLSTVDWLAFSLRYLNLAGNQIRTLQPLNDKLGSLLHLDVSRNLLISIEDSTDNLKHMDILAELSLAENPVVTMPHYRLRALYGLQRLCVLDGELVSADEIVHAKNVYGVFVLEHEKLWKSVHADIPFVDRRTLNESTLNDTTY